MSKVSSQQIFKSQLYAVHAEAHRLEMEHPTEVMSKSYHDREENSDQLYQGELGTTIAVILGLGLVCICCLKKRKISMEDRDSMLGALVWHVLEKFNVCE